MKHRFGTGVTIVSTVLLVGYIFGTLMPSISTSYKPIFTPYIFGLFIGLAGMLTLAVMVLRTRARNAAVTWFTTLVFVVIFWIICYILWAWSVDPLAAKFWQNLLALFWVPLPLVTALFTISYLDEDGILGYPMLRVLLPVASGFLLYLIAQDGVIYTQDLSTQTYHYWGIEAEQGRYMPVTYAWLGTVGMLILGMFIQAYRKTTNRLRKRQTRIFIIALGQFIVAGVAFDAIYYTLTVYYPEIPKIPPMAFFYTGIMALIMGYGIIKYGIFRVNPASLSGTILENLSEAVVAVNNDLEIEFTNKGTEMITGFQEGLLKGQHVSMLFDTQIFQRIRDNLIAGKEFFELDDTLIKNNLGDTVPVTLSVGAVYDERKRKAGSIFVFANISELKRKTIELAQEKASVEMKVRERTKELSEERARLSASINSLRLGYIMTSVDNEIVVMNPSARKILSSLAEAQGIPQPEKWSLGGVQDVMGKSIDIMDPIGKARKEHRPFEFKEVQISGKFLYVFVSPVTRNEEVIGSVILFEDITDERALNRSKEEFFIIASHELRTPLTKIRGSAEVMRDVYKASITSEDALKMLQEIENSSSHLIDIINVIIDITELEQGKVKLKPEEFDLQQLCKEVLAEIQKEQKKDAIEARINSELPELKVVADKGRTKQIVRSFVSNAFKFTEEGSVTIDFAEENGHIKVRFSDTGIGIKTENKSLLFRKFQQAGSSLLSRDGEGTGLGLYVVKLIANIMGAQVGLESSEPGQGSVFYLKLPTSVSNPSETPDHQPLPEQN